MSSGNGSVSRVISGAHAVSYGVRSSRAEVITAYPITPQTSIVELLSEFCADGSLAAKYLKVESEHSAMASLIGSSAAGARGFTATSSHGLALMHEMLHWASGARLPIVMANVNRAMGTPWSIWVDHNDSLSQRDTGWIQYYVSSNQEVLDTILIAFKLGEAVRLPVMVNLDGFYLSHTVEPVELLDQQKADQFLPKWETKWKLDLENPMSIGNLTTPEHYYELRYMIQEAMEEAKTKSEEFQEEFAQLFGRRYHNLESYETDDAETVLITYATHAQTTQQAVKEMPFPAEQIVAMMKPGVKYIVLDRNVGFGVGGLFAQEIKAALYNRNEKMTIFDVLIGIGGRDITPQVIKDVVEEYENCATVEKNYYWEGVKR